MPTKILKHRILSIFLIFTTLILTAYIYWPGLYGPFLLDDMWNLGALNQRGGVNSLENALAFIFSNVSGALGRPVSMATFLLSDQYWPSQEFPFKYVNLMFHLINGVLVFYFIFIVCLRGGITESRALGYAVLGAAFWLLHPLHVSTTLYVIQRMTQLSCLFSLAAMVLYINGRIRVENAQNYGRILILCALGPMAGLGVLSKENGILVFACIGLIEWLLFSDSKIKVTSKRILYGLVWSPICLLLIYLISRVNSFQITYEFRPFSVYERVLTQPFVLFDYLKNIFIPTGLGSGLMQDDFPIASTLLAPDYALVPIAGLALLVALAVWLRKRSPLISLGILIFFAGHLLESSVIPLEMYFEHRNYFPMVGAILALLGALNSLRNIETKALADALIVVVMVFMVSISTAATHQSARIWSNLFDLLTFWATENPSSLRAQRVYGQFLGRTVDWTDVAQRRLSEAYEKFPDDISLPIIMNNIACKKAVASPVPLEEMFSNVESAYYHGGLITSVKNFADLYLTSKCSDQVEAGKVHDFLDDLAEIHGMKGGQKADLLFFHAEKYAEQGNLDRAMYKLEEAAKYQKDFVVPFRQAQYLASAGLYDEALLFLEKSRKWDKRRKRSWFVPSHENIISVLEQKIVTMQNQAEMRKQNDSE